MDYKGAGNPDYAFRGENSLNSIYIVLSCYYIQEFASGSRSLGANEKLFRAYEIWITFRNHPIV